MGDFNFRPSLFFPFQVGVVVESSLVLCSGVGLSWFVAKWLDRCKSNVCLSVYVIGVVVMLVFLCVFLRDACYFFCDTCVWIVWRHMQSQESHRKTQTK